MTYALKELFRRFALSGEGAVRDRAADDIIDYFIGLMISGMQTKVRELGLVFDVEFAMMFQDDYRAYMRNILNGFRLRIRDFIEEMERSDEELDYRLGWEIDRIIHDQERYMREGGEMNAYILLQWLRPNVTITKTWNANVGDPKTCGICLSMHGTTVPVGEPFLRPTQVIVLPDGGFVRYNYIERQSPIAHPNCRCWATINID